MVALVQASVALPIMLLSLVAGAMADNLDRRKVMLAAQIFMLVVSIALAVCAWTGLITPWLLLLFTFLIGCGAAFNAPAWQASVGDMVPRAELPGAVALNSMGFNIARSVGPAIGGAIVAAAGAAAAFAVNAVSYVALIAVLARWRPPPNPQIAAARVARHRDRRGHSLCRDVARHPRRAGAQRRVRHRRERGHGADAAGRQAPDRRRTADLRPAARRVRRRRRRRRAWRRAAAPVAVDRGDRALGERRLRRRRGDRRSEQHAGDHDGGDAGRRRRLGAGALDVQRRGADVRAALGRRARAVALPDGRVRRHRGRQLAVGRRRGQRRHRDCAARGGDRAAGLRGARALAAARAGRQASTSIRCGSGTSRTPRCRSSRAPARS